MQVIVIIAVIVIVITVAVFLTFISRVVSENLFWIVTETVDGIKLTRYHYGERTKL